MLSHGFKKLSASYLPWRVVTRNVRPNEGCGLILVDFRYFCASCNLHDAHQSPIFPISVTSHANVWPWVVLYRGHLRLRCCRRIVKVSRVLFGSSWPPQVVINGCPDGHKQINLLVVRAVSGPWAMGACWGVLWHARWCL